MSVNIDYFFNWPGTVNELAAQFHLWIGSDLRPFEGEDLYCRFLGMEFALSEHDLANDGELNFEDYCFEAGIRTPVPDSDFRTLQAITMVALVYALFRRLSISEGILVYDTGLLLARYEVRVGSHGTPELYDSVSGELVKYPQHITSVMARIPRNTYF